MTACKVPARPQKYVSSTRSGSSPPAGGRRHEDGDVAEREGKVSLRRPGPGPDLGDDEADRIGDEHERDQTELRPRSIVPACASHRRRARLPTAEASSTATR